MLLPYGTDEAFSKNTDYISLNFQNVDSVEILISILNEIIKLNDKNSIQLKKDLIELYSLMPYVEHIIKEYHNN